MAPLKIGILNKRVAVPTTADNNGIYFVKNDTFTGIYIVSAFGGTKQVLKIFNSGDWYDKAQIDTKLQTKQNDIDSLRNELELKSGGPKGSYANLAALIAANPDHQYNYITLDNGWWNYWNGTAFVGGGVYLSTGDAQAKSDVVAPILYPLPDVIIFANLSTQYPTAIFGCAARNLSDGFINSYNGIAWKNTGLKEFPEDVKIASPTFIDFPLIWTPGSYYNSETGAITPSEGWSRSQLVDIENKTISFSISNSYVDNGAVASVVYFKKDGSFLSKDFNLKKPNFYSNKTLHPQGAKFVAFTIFSANTIITIKIASLIYLNDFSIIVNSLVLGKTKKQTFNYNVDYNTLGNLKYVDLGVGDYNGFDSCVSSSSLNKFGDLGYNKELSVINSGAGTTNRSLYYLSKIRPELKISKKINFHFYILSSNSLTISLAFYIKNSEFTNVKSQLIVLVSDVVQEVNLSYDFIDFDFTTLQWLQWYLMDITSGTTIYFSSPEIWDGLTTFDQFSNMLSTKEMNIIRDSSGYVGKNGLYVGDSISTDDNYKWKGYLENHYGLSYIRGIEGQMQPAQGGISLYPPITETVGHESIWYRCAGQRLSIYNPDVKFLFGGTNDLEAGYDLGSATDIAYKDTDIRPTHLTWCAALKGCIEMQQRDFPNIELILCTVLDTTGYGSTMYDATYNVRETIAIRTMAIANLYNLKCVPLFWDSGITARNTASFTLDTIHPNRYGAKGIEKCIAETLALR